MNEKKRINELQEEIKKLSKQQSPLIDERNKIQNKISLEENLKLLGKCFKAKNSYSHDKEWDIYSKVVGISSYNITFIDVQIDCDGGASITRQDSSVSFVRCCRKNFISAKEFEKHFNKTVTAIKKMQTKKEAKIEE